MRAPVLSASVLVGLVPSALAASSFYCPSVNATGFQPSCCTSIVGQIGVWCVSAHIIGGLPNFQCNNGPPLNVAGCCQSLNVTNPHTGYDLNACTTTTPYPPRDS